MKRSIYFSSLVTSLGASLLVTACGPEGVPEEQLGETDQALSQNLGVEVEPNGSTATANPIGGDSVTRGSVVVLGDNDFFSFQGSAGDRVFSTTMTSASPSSADSVLELYSTDGATLIETDDNNGTLSTLAASIAGAPLTDTGMHFIKVRAASTTSRMFPYDLHFKVQSGTPTPETEPNDMTPQILPMSGYVSGVLSSATDIDTFAIALQAGDTIFASLDLDPTRDGTEWNGQVGIGYFGTNTLIANDAGNLTGPESEAFVATVKNAGTYGVGVAAPAGVTTVGDYVLSVAIHPATPATANCTTYTSTDPPQAIPTGPGAITSTIVVPGHPRIADIDVSLQLNHAAPGDLDLYLTSPAGNTNGLATDVGATTFPNWDLTFDNAGAFPVSTTAQQNMFEGLVVQPEIDYRLEWLQGEDAGGTWTLNVLDDTTNNGGNFQGWSITICEPPPPAACAGILPAATLYTTDFESGADGFTHNGLQDEWAVGTPTAAPIASCNSGMSCFKTDLTGTYNASANANLVSPPIDLSGHIAPLSLSWAMKYQLESTVYDRVWVDVRQVGGANPRRVWESKNATMTTSVGNPSVTLQESAGWGIYNADVSSFAGQQIEVVVHIETDGSGQYAGVAIDDVMVTGCIPCGNAVVDMGETCDDGNATDGDGCDSNCTMTGCGNGIMTTGETCDDGNTTNNDGCDSNCTPTGCGNGVIAGSEVCDDGNTADGDGCDSNCTMTACGNGVVTMGETCDDGNTTDNDGCDSNCKPTGCGNGILTTGEVCDDGNTTSGDGCDSNCKPTGCGNGVVTMGETCDDGNTANGDGCDSNCTPTGCGNGIRTMGEECDDTNTTSGDGCDSNCKLTRCGNGVVTMGETCDDSNTTNGDGCDSNCTPTGCGNTIITMGEVCDDGNTIDADGCDSNCKPTGCGNGVRTGAEVCDDGNTIDGDGCDSNCRPSGCGNGILNMNEVCDDANTINGDGCDNNCTMTACGNNVVTMGETCDDGNLIDHDGCDSNCTPTGCGNDILNPGEICDDGNAVNGDGCDNNCTMSACGNGAVGVNEGCDDGNLTDDDGCDSNCKKTGCGNGIVTSGELCDDGNLTNDDGCDSNCKTTGCGNGVVTSGELCDDGNQADNDGCDSNCTPTACGNGAKSSIEECDDGNTIEGDGCDTNCTITACGNGIKTKDEKCDDGNATEGDGCDSNCTVTACGNGILTSGEQCDDGNTAGGDGCATDCTTEDGAGGGGGGGTGPADGGSCDCSLPGSNSSNVPASSAAIGLLGLVLARLRRIRRR
ncbi:MAG TPA: DUF4215 domain-containing protein [Polyangium sp.]|nr:DUF4215 domain-containing protein [Polyangium sp.]